MARFFGIGEEKRLAASRTRRYQEIPHFVNTKLLLKKLAMLGKYSSKPFSHELQSHISFPIIPSLEHQHQPLNLWFIGLVSRKIHRKALHLMVKTHGFRVRSWSAGVAKAFQWHPDLLSRRKRQTLQDGSDGLRQLPAELRGVAQRRVGTGQELTHHRQETANTWGTQKGFQAKKKRIGELLVPQKKKIEK